MVRNLKTKSVKVYRPIQWSLNFAVKGGATMQQHDADNNLFYPDREVTPTLLEPVFRIIDRDRKTSREATSELINISWKQIVNGKAATECNTPDYDVITDATEDMRKGSIVVNKNVPYLTNILLKFSAQYYDSVRKRTLKVEGAIPLTTSSAASLLLYTKLDKPNCIICDPFVMETQPSEVIKPIFQLGDEKVTDLGFIGGWWYEVYAGVEIPVNVAEDITFDKLDTATFALTVSKTCVRDTLLRFKSALFPDKKIPASPPANCNRNDIRLVRKYPPGIEFEVFTSGGGFVSGAATKTIGRVIVTGSRGIIPDPDRYWTFTWQTKSTSAGSVYKDVTKGAGPVELPLLDEIDINVKVEEKGPLAAVFSGGAMLVSGSKAVVTQLER